jgi:phosphate transport system substrate-binding protein
MNKAVMNALMLIVAALPTTSYARDQLMIVGSSTVFPYTQAVAEQYTQMTGSPAPVVESTGTGGGFKVFCGGIGLNFADITGASRAIKDSEVELCNQNGVTDVKEVLIGYDGLSIASAIGGIEIELTKQHIFQALASEVVVDGAIVANPYKSWNEIDASLPSIPITVFGPPPTSGTRDAFVELVMHEGCASFPEIEALADDRKKEVCDRMRQDGPFIEAGENDNLIVQRLLADNNTLGIFGYSFLYENSDTLKGISVDGVFPNPETIADASYSVSRPLYVYIKNAHLNIIPGMNEFVEEYLSDAAIGPDGYLLERGLIPITN